jgi:PPOX class probable F420-dependent enzyme
VDALDEARWLARAADEPVARLGTVSARTGHVDLVPVTFVIHAGRFVTSVDHKPKSTRSLARLANVRASGRATALVDHWDEDWSRLWWVRLQGDAVELDDMTSVFAVDAVDALVLKHVQYREHRPAGPLLVLTPTEVRGWSATGA